MALTDQKGTSKSGSWFGFTYPLIHECLAELGTCTQRPCMHSGILQPAQQHLVCRWKKKKMNFYHRYDRKIALCTFIMYNKQLHSLERHSNNANQTEIEKKREGGCHWLENNIKEVQAYHWLYTCEMHKRVVCIVLCIGSSPLISVWSLPSPPRGMRRNDHSKQVAEFTRRL